MTRELPDVSGGVGMARGLFGQVLLANGKGAWCRPDLEARFQKVFFGTGMMSISAAS